MKCPKCSSEETRVLDTRPGNDGTSIRRRRYCGICGLRFSTLEMPIREEVSVIKRDGRMEEFDRAKIKMSLQKALKKEALLQEKIEPLLESITRAVLKDGKTSIHSRDIGQIVLDHLKENDYFAYIRYLSIHQTFNSLEEFHSQISNGPHGEHPQQETAD